MKYIVNSIVNLILDNAPSKDGEMMIRIDNFEDIRIYEAVAQNVTKLLGQKNLSVKIKLAKSKWKLLKNKAASSVYVQNMEINHWIAEEESITHYRNLHDTNVLILLGTENEEDQGGLRNCYAISPDTLVKELAQNYYEVFARDFFFSQTEIDAINMLYKDLFEFVAVDLCKLSDLFDSWTNSISTFDEVVELFYASLPVWGLPAKKLVLPQLKDLKAKKNILRGEYNFISRQMFKKLSKAQFDKIKKQIEQYEQEKNDYCSAWKGWSSQGIKSYDALKKIILEYARGVDVVTNKELLLKTDFSIIEAILGIKVPSGKKETVTTPVISGEPLIAFSNALLQMLAIAKDLDQEVCTIQFNISQAELVSMYSETEEEEEVLQLKNTWLTVCRHLNGVFEYLNQANWCLRQKKIEITYLPDLVFSPASATTLIEQGIVKAASANKKISKLELEASCLDKNHNKMKLAPRKDHQPFIWKFCATEGWLHSFMELCEQENIANSDTGYIPMATITKFPPLLFVSSEEEFFDLYEERDLDFTFNLVEHAKENLQGNHQNIYELLQGVGKSFVLFVQRMRENGFYFTINSSQTELENLSQAYIELGKLLLNTSLPENQAWLLDAYIHAFNIEESTKVIYDDNQSRYAIVPAWHPAALEKMKEQREFFLRGCLEWWEENQEEKRIGKAAISEMISKLLQMSQLQSVVDLFPSYGQQYFGLIHTFGAFSVYGRNDIKNNRRLKDMIRKDAIYDDDFDTKENARMTENAKMIYGVIMDYMKAFPDAYHNLSIAFLDPNELQPIVASIYQYIEVQKKRHPDRKLNLSLKILVKPENKGGRNYLAYWMDECFSQDANVSIRTYLNEWRTKDDIDKILNGNNDIVFSMELLTVDSLSFIKEYQVTQPKQGQCRFPIVQKPSPVSGTSSNVKRRIELSQPQFAASYVHTQVVRYRNNSESLPNANYIAVKQVSINSEVQEIIQLLHEKAYWVVCIGSGMDGALLRNDSLQGKYTNDYSIIGFSTGKGTQGQYNLTITARKTILQTIQKKLEARLYQLFRWERDKIEAAAKICITEAGGLDGISLLSAINQRDHNVNEFMAYVLTSLLEKENHEDSALKVVIHLDSYKHWFSCEMELDEEGTKSRPDFLVLEARLTKQDELVLLATVTECKMSMLANSLQHKEHAYEQVEHGIRRLSTIFDPFSTSVKRRYWYAQLYRALAFAQITFSSESSDFSKLASKLRSILDGEFSIEWSGKILGFWLDQDGTDVVISDTENPGIKMHDIPQKKIQSLLLNRSGQEMEYVTVDPPMLSEEEENAQIREWEKQLLEELKKKNQRKGKGSGRFGQAGAEKMPDGNGSLGGNGFGDVNAGSAMDEAGAGNKSESLNGNGFGGVNTGSLGNEADNGNRSESLNGNGSGGVNAGSAMDEAGTGNRNGSLNGNRGINENPMPDISGTVPENGGTNMEITGEGNEPSTVHRPPISLEDTRVLIGNDKFSNQVYWEFGHPQLANRHLLITGTSGQGKTYSIQTMLFELSKSKVSSVIFDYTEGFRSNQLETDFKDKMENRIQEHFVKFDGVPINPFKRQYIEFADIVLPEKDADIASRFANIMAHVYKFGDQQTSAIFEAVRVGLEKYDNQMNMRHFQEELENVKKTNKTAQTVISKLQPFFFSVQFNNDTEFDWGNVLYPSEATATIFQLTAMDRDMQVVVTELMLWDLWYYSTKNGTKEKPFVVVLDEAQNLSHKEKSPSCKILTEGRKFGWSAWYATQSLQVLSEDEVTRLLQSAFRVYFKPTDAEIVKISKQLDPVASGSWVSALKGLKKGQCVVVGERKRMDDTFGPGKPAVTNVIAFSERK